MDKVFDNIVTTGAAIRAMKMQNMMEPHWSENNNAYMIQSNLSESKGRRVDNICSTSYFDSQETKS